MTLRQPLLVVARGKPDTFLRHMAIGRYKLARHIRKSFFAEVTVEAEETQTCPKTTIVVSNSAFDWLKDEYGPNAYEWPACQGYRKGAIFGAQYALAHTATGVATVRLTVTRIYAHPAHSDDACVAYASCFATWDALRVQGRSAPSISADGIRFDTSEPVD